MKTLFSPPLKSVSFFATMLSLAAMVACGGTTANSNSNGGSGGGGGAAAAQYLYVNSASNSGFKINSDGTLTPIPNFPSIPTGNLATAKNFLVDNDCNTSSCQMSLYNISRTTGSLTLSSTTTTMGGSAAFDPSASSAYAVDGTQSNSGTVSAFSITSGSLSSAPGSPYQYSIGGGSNPIFADLVKVDPSGKYVYMPFTPANFHTPAGWFGVAVRNADGSLGTFTSYAAGCIGTGTMAVATEPSATLVFGSCVDDFSGSYWISGIVVDATGAVTASGASFVSPDPNGILLGLAVDPSGKWLAVTDVTNNVVHIMAINPANGALTDAADHIFPTGTGPNAAAFDATGKFLYITNGGYQAAGSNDVSVYTFNANTGLLTPVPGSPFATGAFPRDLAIAQP